MTIDRIDGARGYCIENIQAISLQRNVLKSFTDGSRGKVEIVSADFDGNPIDDCPF